MGMMVVLVGVPTLFPSPAAGRPVAGGADLWPICKTIPAHLRQLPSGSETPGQAPQHSCHPIQLATVDGVT